MKKNVKRSWRVDLSCWIYVSTIAIYFIFSFLMFCFYHFSLKPRTLKTKFKTVFTNSFCFISLLFSLLFLLPLVLFLLLLFVLFKPQVLLVGKRCLIRLQKQNFIIIQIMDVPGKNHKQSTTIKEPCCVIKKKRNL